MHPRRVGIEIIEGKCKGQQFDFAEQDTFIIGRAEDCQCVVTGDDTFSRHHLLLEINQSNVTLKDLGSLNGTRVNGHRIYDGRGKDVDPNKAESSRPLGLRDGDRIEAGNNAMLLHIMAPAFCVDCGAEISATDKKACEFVNGSYLCRSCRQREDEKNQRGKDEHIKEPAQLRMNRDQREQAEQNPAAVVDQLVREFLRIRGINGAPPQIEGYKGFEKIGEGGFGAVYKAERLRDGKTVVLKTMLQTRKPDKRSLLLFEREKEIIVQLRHPNIVRSETAGVWDDIHFIEMEFAEGGSLWGMMQEGRHAIDLETAAPFILQMLEGLAYAHEVELVVTTTSGKRKQTGVIHRDLKPPNVLLARSGDRFVAQLSDFGLAKAFGAAGCTQGALSVAGTTCGSPAYMAPEHLTNYKYIKPSTDVFEMAATIFHVLTGRTVRSIARGRDPFRCVLEEPLHKLKDHLKGCPRRLSEVIDRGLAINPKDRYVNGREFLSAMRDAL